MQELDGMVWSQEAAESALKLFQKRLRKLMARDYFECPTEQGVRTRMREAAARFGE